MGISTKKKTSKDIDSRFSFYQNIKSSFYLNMIYSYKIKHTFYALKHRTN